MTIETGNNFKSNNTLTSHVSTGAANKSTATNDSSTASTGEVSNTVVLSTEAQNIARLQDKIASVSPVDSERVSEIKQAITEGRFSVNPERIAEAMLSYEELLGS